MRNKFFGYEWVTIITSHYLQLYIHDIYLNIANEISTAFRILFSTSFSLPRTNLYHFSLKQAVHACSAAVIIY